MRLRKRPGRETPVHEIYARAIVRQMQAIDAAPTRTPGQRKDMARAIAVLVALNENYSAELKRRAANRPAKTERALKKELWLGLHAILAARKVAAGVASSPSGG